MLSECFGALPVVTYFLTDEAQRSGRVAYQKFPHLKASSVTDVYEISP